MKKIVVVVLLLSTFIYAGGLPAWYYKIKNISVQKKKFVQIILPLIKKANKKTLEERKFVVSFFNQLETKGFSSIDKKKMRELVFLSKKYKIKNLFDKYEYLLKIDKVPESLALTQAAIESAWGKSRFAKYADNIFGQWTYGEKGLVPADREKGKKHKIKIFKSLQASVNAYVANLNRNNAYKDFRILRYQARVLDEMYSGIDAAKTMVKYSQLRGKYVKMITSFIKDNGFLKYDTVVRENSLNQPLYASLR